MRRLVHVFLLVAVCVCLDCFPSLADSYELNPGDYAVDAVEEIATPSDALYVAYGSVYDGSISTSVLQYFRDSGVPYGNQYVFFRSGQYTYRLVYAKDMTYENGTYYSLDAQYLAYDTRNYTMWSGAEGEFTLRPGDMMVYSSFPGSPSLRDSRQDAILFVLVMMFLLSILRAFFYPANFSF